MPHLSGRVRQLEVDQHCAAAGRLHSLKGCGVLLQTLFDSAHSAGQLMGRCSCLGRSVTIEPVVVRGVGCLQTIQPLWLGVSSSPFLIFHHAAAPCAVMEEKASCSLHFTFSLSHRAAASCAAMKADSNPFFVYPRWVHQTLIRPSARPQCANPSAIQPHRCVIQIVKTKRYCRLLMKATKDRDIHMRFTSPHTSQASQMLGTLQYEASRSLIEDLR